MTPSRVVLVPRWEAVGNTGLDIRNLVDGEGMQSFLRLELATRCSIMLQGTGFYTLIWHLASGVRTATPNCISTVLILTLNRVRVFRYQSNRWDGPILCQLFRTVNSHELQRCCVVHTTAMFTERTLPAKGMVLPGRVEL